MRALDNANDAPFRAVAAFCSRVTLIARNPRHDLVAMHGRARVLGGDEEIRFAAFFARQESKTGLMNGERSRHKISFRWQHIPVLPNPRDLAVALHFTQDRVQVHPHAALSAKRLSQFDVVERAIAWRAQHGQDLFAQLSALSFHKITTVRANWRDR